MANAEVAQTKYVLKDERVKRWIYTLASHKSFPVQTILGDVRTSESES